MQRLAKRCSIQNHDSEEECFKQFTAIIASSLAVGVAMGKGSSSSPCPDTEIQKAPCCPEKERKQNELIDVHVHISGGERWVRYSIAYFLHMSPTEIGSCAENDF
jgi:hypothetical protein